MLRINLDDLVEQTGLPPLAATLTLIEYASLVYNRTPKVKYRQGRIIIESLVVFSEKYDLKEIYSLINSPYEMLLKNILQELIKKFNIDVYLLKVTFYNYFSSKQKSNEMPRESKKRKRGHRFGMY